MFLSYADNRHNTDTHTDTHRDTHTDTQTHRSNAKNVIFGFRGRVNPPKSPLRNFDQKTILSLLIGKRK